VVNIKFLQGAAFSPDTLPARSRKKAPQKEQNHQDESDIEPKVSFELLPQTFHSAIRANFPISEFLHVRYF